jgi:hypothetical protein
MRNSLLFAAFNGWLRWCTVRKKLLKATMRIANRGLVRVMDTWRLHCVKMARLQRFWRRVQTAEVKRVFISWKHDARVSKIARVKSVEQQQASSSFERQEQTIERLSDFVARVVASDTAIGGLGVCFSAWQEWTSTQSMRNAALAHAVTKYARLVQTHALLAWQNLSKRQIRIKYLEKKCLAAWISTCLA